ncbi:hypothetical protein CRUP_025375 [Coryphaenoides rupestris]|nr:hypothetical protein CRUP_025375 [Coryphaenoides rupestris]
MVDGERNGEGRRRRMRRRRKGEESEVAAKIGGVGAVCGIATLRRRLEVWEGSGGVKGVPTGMSSTPRLIPVDGTTALECFTDLAAGKPGDSVATPNSHRKRRVTRRKGRCVVPESANSDQEPSSPSEEVEEDQGRGNVANTPRRHTTQRHHPQTTTTEPQRGTPNSGFRCYAKFHRKRRVTRRKGRCVVPESANSDQGAFITI